MRAVLDALTDELRRLKATGVKTVSVSAESLAALSVAARKQAGAQKVGGAAAEPVSAPKAPTAAPIATAATAKAPVVEPAAPAWTPPKASAVAATPSVETRKLPTPQSFTLPEGDKATRWAWLRDRVLGDSTCKAQVRAGKKVVFGVGDIDAKVMFVGEAPGAEEEVQGEPFVGPAGQLLTKMILAMGVKREQVYIGNIMNWRPQLAVGPDGVQYGNREPTEEEMNYCLPFLRAQIEVVQPTLVVALGATAAKGLLGFRAFKTLGEVRGRWHDYIGRPLRVTYHPSYLLRKESESPVAARRAKRVAWEDFLAIMERAELPISDKQRGFFQEK